MTKTQGGLFRRIAVTVSLCLLLALTALALPARAADVDIMFNDPSALVGNTVRVNVYTTGDVAGVDLTIVYDTEYLSYTGSSGGLGNASVQESGGTITVVDYHSTSAARFSLDLSFTAKKAGTTVLRPTACTVSDASGDLLSVEYASHSSSVKLSSASSNCDLSALYIDPGTLSPAFSAGQTNYTVTVPNSAAWLAVSPVKSDASASYTISGNDRLNVGLNYVTVTVTAGSGAQKIYTLAVTRLAADSRPTPAPDNTVDTSPEEEPVYAAAPDGTQLSIGSFDAGRIPDGFTAAELSYKGKNIPAIRSADGQYGVWCRGSAAYPDGFFLLDVSAGTVTPMNTVTVAGGSWLVLHPSLSTLPPPAECDEASVEIGSIRCTAYVPRSGGEYVILWAVSPEGHSGYYQYDTREKTLQRWGLSDAALVRGETPAILDPVSHAVATPEGYVLMDLIVEGSTCRGFVPASGESSSYFVLYAQRVGEEPGLYTYDTAEKTWQRFGLLRPVETAAPAEAETPEDDAVQQLQKAENRLRTGRILLAVLGLVTLCSLVSVVILAVLYNRRRY